MKEIFNKLYIVIISLVILTISVSFFLIKDSDFSSMENRSLTKAPTLSAEKILSGEYTLQVGRYYADQFPLRDEFISLKAYSEICQLKNENNAVILTQNGIMIPRPEPAEDRLEDNLEAVLALEKNTGVNVYLAAVPRSVDVFKEYLPYGYSSDAEDLMWERLNVVAKNLGIKSINLLTPLCDSNEYYKTDHHYTSCGAYITYANLGESLGYTPKAKDNFRIETVADDFCGTSMRKSGFYFAEKDSIQLYRYDGDTEYNIVADGENIELYDLTKLETVDKYAVFLGGNHERVDLTLEGANRKKLLVIRDSFADSLTPFLAQHFDIVLIDLRYFTDSVAEIVKTSQIDEVLVIESISEIYSAKNLSLLKMP